MTSVIIIELQESSVISATVGRTSSGGDPVISSTDGRESILGKLEGVLLGSRETTLGVAGASPSSTNLGIREGWRLGKVDGEFDRTSLGSMDFASLGGGGGGSSIPLSTPTTVGIAEDNSPEYELGNSEGSLLGPGNADGAKVGGSTIPSFNGVGRSDGISLGISEGPSLGPGNTEGVGTSSVPVSPPRSVGSDDGASLGYELGTSDGISLRPGDAEGSKVGGSKMSSLMTVGPTEGNSLGYELGTSD
jgi:hypothetical protein